MSVIWHWRSLPLVLVVALACFEEASSFSSHSLRSTRAVPRHDSAIRLMPTAATASPTQPTLHGRPPQFRNARLTMAADNDNDDDSSDNEVTKAKEKTDDNSDALAQKSNTILFFPLFCKFLVVLLIKFLTDLIVFPTLFLYRLGGRTKRKILAVLDKLLPGSSFPSSIKPNGTAD